MLLDSFGVSWPISKLFPGPRPTGGLTVSAVRRDMLAEATCRQRPLTAVGLTGHGPSTRDRIEFRVVSRIVRRLPVPGYPPSGQGRSSMDLGELINSRGVMRLETKDKTEALEEMIEVLARRRRRSRARTSSGARSRIARRSCPPGSDSASQCPTRRSSRSRSSAPSIGISEEGHPLRVDGRQGR